MNNNTNHDGNYLFTSESVSEGHPDKICDQISDAIVDEYLKNEPEARVAAETLVTTNNVVIAGEVRGPKISDSRFEEIVRGVIKDIGYTQAGFHWEKVNIQNFLHEQSVDIAQGVDESCDKDEGAGDQGLMFGYACDETEALMPAPIYYAHEILKSLSKARRNGEKLLEPDAKSQVTLKYNEHGIPLGLHSVLVSTQHHEDATQEQIRDLISNHVFEVLPKDWSCPDERFLTNPTGKFVIGGPDGDAGLTGRKIIVDTYGGAAPHGGGAFSGKDPTKVDRSAAYMARYLAKNIVAAGLAGQCDIQISYAIGVSQPISFYVNTFRSSKVSNKVIEKFIVDNIDLSPKGIRKHLKLNRPIYQKSATYGHFGRIPDENGSFPWEKIDLIDELKRLV